MQNYVTFLLIICILICLNFNYTFPIHRDITSKNWSLSTSAHNDEHSNIVDRKMKMSPKFEINAVNNKTRRQVNNNKGERNVAVSNKLTDANKLNDEDLREYEQLVIMKKYPFLDLKELHQKYRSDISKNVRQSSKSPGFDSNLGNDPSICEAPDDGPNVEIFNRGLSGFSIPLLKNRFNLEENKEKVDDLKVDKFGDTTQIGIPASDTKTLNSLKDVVLQFEHKLHGTNL